MTPARLFVACVILLLLLLLVPLVAGSAPGDPRLVNGVLEWPGVVTNEPFVIVRGDDGVLYYVGVTAAQRAGAVTAGARVSVLGIEGRSAHEITAVGIGSGRNAEAALAQLQATRAPAPAAPAAAAPVAAPANEVTVVPTPPVTSPAAVSTPPVAPAAPAPLAAPAPSRPTAPATPPPATIDAPAAAPVAGAAVVPAVIAQPPITTTAPMLLPSDDHRWMELVGEVEKVVGRTLVLRVNGARVSVDMSSVGGNLERVVAPGSTVKVYGVPVELRFKAMGFIDPDARAHPPRPN
jgi:hypothetical protein